MQAGNLGSNCPTCKPRCKHLKIDARKTFAFLSFDSFELLCTILQKPQSTVDVSILTQFVFMRFFFCVFIDLFPRRIICYKGHFLCIQEQTLSHSRKYSFFLNLFSIHFLQDTDFFWALKKAIQKAMSLFISLSNE